MKSFLYLILLIIFFLICISSYTQQSITPKTKKAEILLVGVFHHIPDSLSCNWKSVYNKILQYKPDQIAVEYVLPTDTASQISALGTDYQQEWDSLMLAWEGKKINAANRASKLLSKLMKKEDQEKRLLLWKYYYLSPDMANSDYQSYLIHKNKAAYLSYVDTSDNFSKFFVKKHPRIVNFRRNSEFFNLVFPLADTLNIPYLHPTDEKRYYPNQSEAYSKWSEALRDTPYMERVEQFWKEFNETEVAQMPTCQAIEFINSKEWLEKSDYGQAHLLDDAKNEYYTEYVNVWYKRNTSIANRIAQAATTSKARKMAVFYGYMHVAPVKKFLEEQGFTVKLVGDLD